MPQPPPDTDTDRESAGLIVAFDGEPADDVDPAWLEQKLAAACDRLGLRRVALNVVIIDDAAIAAMHEKFLDTPGTTDVITFDLADEPRDPATIDGEVYVCLDEARRRAAQLGHPVGHELLLYAVHGILHLLGYDDHDPAEHAKMHAREDELLTAIGVGAVFHRDRT